MNTKYRIHQAVKLVKIYGLYNEVHRLRYVGKTKKSLDDRLKEHLHGALSKSETHKNRGIRLMWANGFSPTIELFTKVAEYKWKVVERLYIKHYNDLGYNLWNETEGGDGGHSQSEKTKAQISRTVSKILIGHYVSPETKRKIGLKSIGRHKSPKAKQKQKDTMKVWHKKHPEHGKAMSARQQGVPKTLEVRRKIARANTGKCPDAKTREKMSLARMGKPAWNKGLTKETDTRVKKISDGRIKWCAQEKGKKKDGNASI